MSREAVLAKLQAQVKEVQQLKAELEELTAAVERAQKPPPELKELRDQIEKLKAEQKKLEEEEAKLPPEFRVPEKPKPKDTMRHLTAKDRLFPPPNEIEKKTGRVHYAKPEERICHPLPGEQPQQCCGLPDVLARVTVECPNNMVLVTSAAKVDK